MSLGIAIKAPEGIVLAAESRVTLTPSIGGQRVPIHFDNATKMFGFEAPNTFVGLVTYGMAAIGQRTAHSFVPELEATLRTETAERLSVAEMAERLSRFYLAQWQAGMPADYNGPPMTFMIGGFDEGQPYGRVFQIDLPYRPHPVEHNPGDAAFGMTWGGQREFVDRLIQGHDQRIFDIAAQEIQLTEAQATQLRAAFRRQLMMQIPINAMALQDCVDLALFFIRTTIAAQELTVGIRGCGGHIDVATVTRSEGFRYVQRKRIRGERREG